MNRTKMIAVPVTFLNTSFYWDNFIHFGMGPKRATDGTLEITLPMGDKRLPSIAAEDIGKCALGIFTLGPGATAGKTIGIAGELLTGEAMAAAFTRALGQTVRYNAVTPETYRGFGFPGAEDLGNVSGETRLRSGLLRREGRRLLAAPQSRSPELRSMARKEPGSDSTRLRRKQLDLQERRLRTRVRSPADMA
jgi:hypothetical protein